VLLGFYFIIRDKKLARSLGALIKSLGQGKLLAVNLSALFYAVGWILFFYFLGLWNISLLKTSLLWFFGTAMVLVLKSQGPDKPGYFRKLLRHLIEWTLITEFVESFYSFPLWAELMLIPFLVVMVGMSVFSRDEEKYREIRGCINGTLRWLAISIFFLSLYETIDHWRSAFEKEHIMDLFCAPVLTFLFVPFLYFLALYMGYEMLFIRLSFLTKNNPSAYAALKRALLVACKLNLAKLNLAKEGILWVNVQDPAELSAFLGRLATGRKTGDTRPTEPESSV
jgi:hypothetical protein